MEDRRRSSDQGVTEIIHKIDSLVVKVDAVDKKVNEVNDNTKVMSVKLFGSSDADNEQETGRLPKVEHSARAAHKRLDELMAPEGEFGKLKTTVNRWGGAIGAVLFILELLIHAFKH